MIGDSLTDVQAGEAAGCALSILVAEAGQELVVSSSRVRVVPSLSEAVAMLAALSR